MSQTQRGSVTGVEDLDVVVDGDWHTMDALEDFLPYMDSKYKGIKDVIEGSNAPYHDIYNVSHAAPPFAQIDSFDYDSDIAYADDAKLADTSRRGKAKANMAEFGIDHAIVSPSVGLGISTVNNERYAVALANAYNSWVLDVLTAPEDGLYTTMIVAPQKPDKAAEEIDRRADEDGIIGVQLPLTGLSVPLGHQWYDQIYQAAQDNDLPLVLHSSSLGMAKSFPMQYYWCQTYAENHVVSHAFSHMWGLTSILFQGVPERFPGLDFVFQEAGIAWVPYWKWRCDDHYLENGDELPYLDRLPSSYLSDSFYFTTQPLGHTAERPKHMAWAVEMAGTENVIYSSDIPHPDFDPPEELLGRVVSHLDDQDVRNIMGETAMDVFDLG